MFVSGRAASSTSDRNRWRNLKIQMSLGIG